MDIGKNPTTSSSSDEYRKSKRNRTFSSRRSIMVGILFIWSFVFSIVTLLEPIDHVYRQSLNAIVSLIDSISATLLFAIGLSIYLSIGLIFSQSYAARSFVKKISRGILKSEKSFYGTDSTYSTGASARKLASIESRLKSLEQNASGIQPDFSKNWEETKKISIDLAINSLSNEIINGVKKTVSHDRMQVIWNGSLSRLSDQIIVLGSRANLTLWMGIIFCISGLLALWYSFFSSSAYTNALAMPGMEWVELAKTYAPRLTLVIIIEFIGFFFLKMYRATLFEIRYVQNEITNIEMRALALNSSQGDAASTLSAVIEILAKTDRNSIIEKGQTTVEIEKQRASSEADKTVLEAAVSLVHGTEKSSFWRRG